MTKVNFESVSVTGSDHVYSVNGKVESITISAERAAEIGAELATLREQFARLQDMEYAVEAGNTEREDVPADMLKAWFRYVHTGEREDDKEGGE